MEVSKEFEEEFGIPECYEGKIIEVHHIDGDDEVNDYIEEHQNSQGTIEVLITNQEDDYLYGELLNGEIFPYHIELRDIGNGSWVK